MTSPLASTAATPCCPKAKSFLPVRMRLRLFCQLPASCLRAPKTAKSTESARQYPPVAPPSRIAHGCRSLPHSAPSSQLALSASLPACLLCRRSWHLDRHHDQGSSILSVVLGSMHALSRGRVTCTVHRAHVANGVVQPSHCRDTGTTIQTLAECIYYMEADDWQVGICVDLES